MAIAARDQHPAFPQPAYVDAVLWRYMPLWKFESLLKESRLYMPSVNDFKDKLEGTPPQGEADWWERSIQEAGPGKQQDILLSNRDKIAESVLMFRDITYVSCWHMVESEVARYWKDDTEGNPAVAVRTTYRTLMQLLPNYAFMGMVRYIDYKKDRLPERINLLNYFMHKDRDSFSHECEVRVVVPIPIPEGGNAHNNFMSNYFENPKPPFQKAFAPNIDLTLLITSVVMHPNSSPADQYTIETLCRDHKLPAPIRSTFE